MTNPDTNSATDEAALQTDARQSLEVATSPKPGIANFPLPRELRDEIYGYLVDAKRTAYSDTTQAPAVHTYKIHMSITGVNKAIRREAREYLDSKTGLVVVHLTGAGLLRSLKDFSVPIIPTQVGMRYYRDVFRSTPSFLQVLWGRSPLELLLQELDPGRPKVKETYEYVFLMVQQDLSALFHALRFLCLWTRSDAAYITSKKGSPVQLQPDHVSLEREKAGPPDIIFKAHGVQSDRRLSQQAQRQVLQSIRDTTGCSYSIKLSGFDDEGLAREVVELARPGIIWVAAQKWDILDAVMDMRRRMDVCAESAVDGSVQAACVQYKILINYIVKDASIWTGNGSPADAPTLRHWQSVAFDLIMSCAWLGARNGDRQAADQGFTHIVQHLTPSVVMTDPISRGKFLHLLAFVMFDVYLGLLLTADEIDELRTAAAALEICPQDDYITHDIPIYQNAMLQLPPPGTDAQEPFSFDHTQLSCYTMPIRTFDSISTRSPPFPTRPARFENWQDKEHLAALSQEDKKKIQDKQAELGFRVSEF